ncbi:hypothetical protein SAMN05421594_0884 [Chryseobacterium oleae]|uniref:Uncharacterized protein n=1 Tax=Chryseobacterium oleae TaxID=491207 RepID=A0A1I4W3F5_CHROL|nr:hypothetical protein [Chryseobacterium oleae]SFN08184.1 hypothetical protein SAMN05421594_0884 [Chryseobacterium oleae]
MKNLFLLLLLTFLISCHDTDPDPVQKNVVSFDVYVAGKENNKACYWKNNVKVDLVNGTNIDPKKIIVENNNVYVFADGNFWKNNTKYDLYSYLGLPSNSKLQIRNFYVKNNDIYAVGTLRGTAIYPIEHCYWKNGVKNVLFTQTNSNTGGYLTDITVHNSDVYVPVIKYPAPNNSEIGYYKNNNYTSIIQNNSLAHGIESNTNGVFMVIHDTNAHTSYYKNLLTNTNHYSSSGGRVNIVLDNSDIYSFFGQAYYKNGNTIPINNPNGYNDITDLKVLAGNTYMICQMLSQAGSLNIAQKVFINGTETQHIVHTANNVPSGNAFTSVFVVQN